MVELQERFHTLLQLLQVRAPLAIACSGGLDSRFLCHAAYLADVDFLAIHVQGPHIPQRESRYALRYFAENNIPFVSLTLNPLTIPSVARNTPRRCYFCKKYLFQGIKALLSKKQQGHRLLCDGTNLDDLQEYRPGLAALNEEAVFSPLASSQLDKESLRSLARATHLSDDDQKASPCLLTRFAYNETITQTELMTIDRCEEALLNKLERHGLKPQFRLRMTPSPLLQISPFPEEIRPVLHDILLQHKLWPCRLLISERVSGFFDRQEKTENLPLL